MLLSSDASMSPPVCSCHFQAVTDAAPYMTASLLGNMGAWGWGLPDTAWKRHVCMVCVGGEGGDRTSKSQTDRDLETVWRRRLGW